MRSALVENTAIEEGVRIKAQELPSALTNATNDLEGDKGSEMERNSDLVSLHSQK